MMMDDKIKPKAGVVDAKSGAARQGTSTVTVNKGAAQTSAHGEGTTPEGLGYEKDTSDLGAAAAAAKAAKAKKDADAAANPAKPKPKVIDDDTIKSYKSGTTRVPKTGTYKLHENEAVLDNKTAEHYRAAMGALGGGEPTEKPKKEIEHMKVRKAKSGGYIVEHHHTRPEHHKMEEHVMSGMDELHGHMEDHMGEPNDGEADADAGAEAMPSSAAAAMAGGQ